MKRASRGGFTVVEMVIALTIFSVVGYSIAVALEVGTDSRQSVERYAVEGRSLREASSRLTSDVQGSSDARITVTGASGANHQVVLQHPIDVGTTATWGVHDLALGHDASTQNRAAWSIRYRVIDVVSSNGRSTRELVREILDGSGVVQRQNALVEGLRAGNDAPPGFTMVRTGDMWEVTLSTEGSVEGTTGVRAVFHVQARN